MRTWKSSQTLFWRAIIWTGDFHYIHLLEEMRKSFAKETRDLGTRCIRMAFNNVPQRACGHFSSNAPLASDLKAAAFLRWTVMS